MQMQIAACCFDRFTSALQLKKKELDRIFIILIDTIQTKSHLQYFKEVFFYHYSRWNTSKYSFYIV